MISLFLTIALGHAHLASTASILMQVRSAETVTGSSHFPGWIEVDLVITDLSTGVVFDTKKRGMPYRFEPGSGVFPGLASVLAGPVRGGVIEFLCPISQILPTGTPQYRAYANTWGQVTVKLIRMQNEDRTVSSFRW